MANGYNCVNAEGCKYNSAFGCGLGGCRSATERKRGKDWKYIARLDMTAIVSDPLNNYNSLSSGTITEITQQGVRLERGDGGHDFVKWCNVRELNNG